MKKINSEVISIFESQLGENRLKKSEPLSVHTYFRIGGPAAMYFESTSTGELERAVKLAIEMEIDYVVLGGGANVLVSDEEFDGIVVRNRAEGIKVVGFKGAIKGDQKSVSNVFVQAESGTPMNRLARFTIDEGLSGLEFLLSVPGTVGGGLKINSHFRPERNEFLGNSVYRAVLLDKKGKTKEVDRDYFRFGYDDSILQKTGEVVLSATFRLEKVSDPHRLWQEATKQLAYRNETQPVGVACSGCIFRNFDKDDAKRIVSPLLTTSAGYLIERMGFKGSKIGDAQVSEKHANYILNLGHATASDVVKLMRMIKEKASRDYSIDLEEEIFLIGEFKNV